MKRRQHDKRSIILRRVYVGFRDARPYRYAAAEMENGATYAVYQSRRAARREFKDVRVGWMALSGVREKAETEGR